MAETLGSLVDKLTIVNLKIWNKEVVAHNNDLDDHTVAEAKRAINVLNNQRSELKAEIDQLFYEVTRGERNPPKVWYEFKDYKKK